tara:strand:+ start:8069 stop:8245 length:177 start_codon:yes stop_codon:yes gene_type:complete
METYRVCIELDSIEFKVKAKNEAEARKKALAKLKRKNPIALIKRSWRSNKREIDIYNF